MTRSAWDIEAPFAGLSVVRARLLVGAGENGMHGVRVELRGDAALWEAVRTRGLFGYAPERCGPVFGGAFREDRPFDVTVALGEPHLSAIALLAAGPEDVVAAIAGAPNGSALRTPAAWTLVAVMQPARPGVQVGMTTDAFAAEAG